MLSHRPGVVLVIDDEAELRFIVGAHLRTAGFEVVATGDGREAIELALKQSPDVIIMDIGLPGIDGVTATRLLKADPRTRDIPIIMVTARAGSADVIRGLEAGAQEYLAKPFDVAELLARVRSVYRLVRAHRDLDRLNAQLEAEVDAKTVRLRHLYEYMRDLNQADTIDAVLDLLVRCVQATTGARRISVFLQDEPSKTLVCRRAVGMNSQVAHELSVPNAHGITGQVFRTGKTLAARTVGDAATPTNATKYESDEFLSTPLFSASLHTVEGVIGVVNVTEKPDGGPFSDEEIDGIRSIADAAAIALDNVVRRERLRQSVRVLLRTLGHLAEFRDEETTQHLERVATMVRVLAEEVRREGPYASQVNQEFIDSLVLAAPMHDIGKVGIPDDILTKPGRLTDEEFQIMKTHTDIGRRVLSRAIDPAHPVPLLQMCVDIAYCHHERFDGKGYPRRIAGPAIPLAARMVTLVDAYDAITSHRRYKPARPHTEAIEVVRSESGKHFDPVLVDAFLRKESEFDRIRAAHQETEVETPVLTQKGTV